MYKRLKQYALYLAILSVFGMPINAATAGMYGRQHLQDKEGAMAADALIARPLGIAATATGFGLFVISLPFSLLGGNTGQAWRALVVSPGQFTFARRLGDFDRATAPGKN